jgi:dTDP-4-dehydrorhamnose reductase
MTARRKLIVTGGSGFVAGSVLAQAGESWQVHVLTRGEPLLQRHNLCWHRCDPLAPRQLAELFHELLPDAVIHTAAAADIDYCERHPDAARAANLELTRTVARLCTETAARLVFCSTDTVFDGEHAPYNEHHLPGPVNYYGETKVEAERLVSGLGAPAVIARLSLVVGLPVFGTGNSFLARMVAAFKESRTVPASPQEVRTPVDVLTAGRALIELAAEDHGGIFHLAGHDRLTRVEIAERVALRFGFSPKLVVAQSAVNIPGRAPRPRDVSLDNSKACANLQTPMLTFDESLSLILKANLERRA